jgi:hypothetical protein
MVLRICCGSNSNIASYPRISSVARPCVSFRFRSFAGSTRRRMSTHEEHTTLVPPQAHTHHVYLDKISPVKEDVRLIRLTIPDRATFGQDLLSISFYVCSFTNPPSLQCSFLPGQWVDLEIPGISQVGGFTITSPPSKAQASTRHLFPNRFVELAVQKAPRNPPAAWLWQPEAEIVGSRLGIRIGGSFVWPPPHLSVDQIRRLVLIAGGVGIKYVEHPQSGDTRLFSLVTNWRRSPFMSILSEFHLDPPPFLQSVHLLYSSRVPPNGDHQSLLFRHRLDPIFSSSMATRWRLELYLTNRKTPPISAINRYASSPESAEPQPPNQKIHSRRMSHGDAIDALGPVTDRGGVVAYVCGPREMTDEMVGVLRGAEGMAEERVLCEKWW